MNEGYFYVQRRLIGSDMWLSEPFSRGQAWLDLIALANFQDGEIRVRGVLVAVKRGQVSWSEVKLAERWKWSRGKVRRFLGELKTKQQIVQQTGNVTTLMTIVNYGKYQPRSTTDRTANGTASDTANRTANGQQTVPLKEKISKGKKDKEGKYSDEFEQWWKVFRKGSKFAAYKRWNEHRNAIPENIIELTRKYLDHCKSTDRIQKDGEGWLNNRMWEGYWKIENHPPQQRLTFTEQAEQRKQQANDQAIADEWANAGPQGRNGRNGRR